MKYDEIYAEWSPNEKVAMEVAIGASISGVRAMASMKHVGVNVASDPLYTASYTGVGGGLVLVANPMEVSLYSARFTGKLLPSAAIASMRFGDRKRNLYKAGGIQCEYAAPCASFGKSRGPAGRGSGTSADSCLAEMVNADSRHNFPF